MVFADAFARIADEADHAGAQIGNAAEVIVDHAAARLCVQRIDGEISPRGIVLPFAGECHGRAPPVGRDVLAQRGHFDIPALAQRGDGAVFDPRGDGANAGSVAGSDHLLRRQRGRRVDIVDRHARQRIAHAAAHPAHVPVTQRGDELREVFAVQPFGVDGGGFGIVHGIGHRASFTTPPALVEWRSAGFRRPSVPTTRSAPAGGRDWR